MKEVTDARLKAAKEVSKESLLEKLKASDPVRFDQMIIESEERKTYYYVNYKAISCTRIPYTIEFPLHKDLKRIFESEFLSSGSSRTPVLTENRRFIEKISDSSSNARRNVNYLSEKLVFSELHLAAVGEIINPEQPYYFIPSETESCTCPKCDGEKYLPCPNNECGGQHIYDCDECRATGEIECGKCSGRGENKCRSCDGMGDKKCSRCSGKGVKSCSGCGGHGKKWTGQSQTMCSRCHGSGTEKCFDCHGDGRLRCTKCTGKGIIKCDTCKARGRVTCPKCRGKRQIVCSKCYGDHVDDRYGKVDCTTCETAGEIGTLSYIETKVDVYDDDFIFVPGKRIEVIDVASIKKYVSAQQPRSETYFNLNGTSREKLDEHSRLCAEYGRSLARIGTDDYPKIVSEEMYYEGVPCVTFNYNHFLTATFHDVSVLAIDTAKEIVYHSNPTAPSEKKESFKEKTKELCRKAFSTKSYLNKIDRRNEMFLMIQMAKADGVIEEKEKRYLAGVITGLDGFTGKEKTELFALMSSATTPPITNENARFSSATRAQEAAKKITELVAKADADYEATERQKMQEITAAIDSAQKSKPNWFVNFLKTWQVSVSILLILVLLAFGVYFFAVTVPRMQAEKKAKIEAEKNKLLEEEKQANLLAQQKSISIVMGTWTGKMHGKKVVVEITTINNGELSGFVTIGDSKRNINGTFETDSSQFDCSIQFIANMEEVKGDEIIGRYIFTFMGEEDKEEGENGTICKGNLKPVESEAEWMSTVTDKTGNFKIKKNN